jgi:hypothetical protein
LKGKSTELGSGSATPPTAGNAFAVDDSDNPAAVDTNQIVQESEPLTTETNIAIRTTSRIAPEAGTTDPTDGSAAIESSGIGELSYLISVVIKK